MTINRVEIKDFLVFRDEFSADFCPGVNVLIGGNGTGKTTLLKVMYRMCNAGKNGNSRYTEEYFFASGWKGMELSSRPFDYLRMEASAKGLKNRICVKSLNQSGLGEDEGGGDKVIKDGKWVIYRSDEFVDEYTKSNSASYGDMQDELEFTSADFKPLPAIYIPANDLLTHSKGLSEMIKDYEMDFDATQVDILKNAQRPSTRDIKPNCGKVIMKIKDIIGGEVIFVNGRFYIKKDNGLSVEFAVEASGFKRLGLLWKLLRNGLLESGTVLFWDEPENSLNPENVPTLVDILLELSRNGVQIFIATHSELLASYFAVNRNSADEVLFTALYKDGGQIKANTGKRFDILEPNNLLSEPVKLYEKELKKGLGGNG